MASGLSLPIRVVNGRAAIDRGEDQLKKIIALKISDCESDNPFQDLGIDPTIVFALNDSGARAFMQRRIINVFQSLQADRYAQLLTGYPQFSQDTEGELICTIKYVNLETTETQELTLKGSSPFEMFRSSTQGSL